MKTPTRIFGQLSRFFLMGGVVAALVMKSWVPLIAVVLALWGLLGFSHALQRRRN